MNQLRSGDTEANVVAASIVIAALGSPGCTYDWSWMMPFGAWLMGVLNAYVAAQIEPLSDGLTGKDRGLFAARRASSPRGRPARHDRSGARAEIG